MRHFTSIDQGLIGWAILKLGDEFFAFGRTDRVGQYEIDAIGSEYDTYIDSSLFIDHCWRV